MLKAAEYSQMETLPDGAVAEIRALRPADRSDFMVAVSRIGSQSLYRRFFSAKRAFSEQEQDFFLNVDFVNHVALVALIKEGGASTIVGGCRYVIVKPGQAEVAFAVVDGYQGKGLGSALMRHLIAVARDAGIQELIAEVLPENTAMLKVLEKSGLPISTRRVSQIVHVVLRLV